MKDLTVCEIPGGERKKLNLLCWSGPPVDTKQPGHNYRWLLLLHRQGKAAESRLSGLTQDRKEESFCTKAPQESPAVSY